MGIDEASRSFKNVVLSYRGAERQAPNGLQLALTMSSIMELRMKSQEHPQAWTTEERLRAVVNDFHATPGLNAKNHVDEDKFKGILNLISGTTCHTRDLIAAHLHHNKWAYSAFSVEQFKSQRWLLGSAPKMAVCAMRKALVVTEEAQSLHIQLVVKTFADEGRKLRPSARSRKRLTAEQWERYCDFACVYAAVIAEGRQLSTWTAEKEAEIIKLFFHRLSKCLS